MAFCTLHFFSEALNREVSVNAFVPQNREGYKTLYLLHGLSDDQTVWQRYTEVELDAAQAGIAVIMPTATGASIPIFPPVTAISPISPRSFRK